MAKDTATAKERKPPQGGSGTAEASAPLAVQASASERFFRDAGVIAHPTLAVARLALMIECDYIQKQKSKELGYSYASEAATVGAMHAACAKHGVTITPVKQETVLSEVYKTKHGTAMNRTILSVDYSIRHAFSGETETAQSRGEGADTGDKSTSKALTNAFKYLLFQANMLERGDDPDTTPSGFQERAPEPQTKQPEPKQPAPQRQPAPQPTLRELFDRLVADIRRCPNKAALDKLAETVKGTAWEGDGRRQLIGELNDRLHVLHPPAPAPEPEPDPLPGGATEDIPFSFLPWIAPFIGLGSALSLLMA